MTGPVKAETVWDIPRRCVCDWRFAARPRPWRWELAAIQAACPVHGTVKERAA